METAINSPKVSFEDFYEVPDLKFDIERLRADLEKILEEKTEQFKKLKGKVSDNSIKKSVGTLKKHGLFGDKKNQLKFGQPLKSKQTIQLYQQINAANMMAGGPSKTNVKDTINANQNIPQTRKESMIQDLDQMSDSEVQNIGLQM